MKLLEKSEINFFKYFESNFFQKTDFRIFKFLFFFRMAEVAVRHNVKTVGKNEGEVIVDNDRVVRERNPELDKLMEYLSSMSEMMKTEEDVTVKNNLCLNCMKEIIQHHEGKAHK